MARAKRVKPELLASLIAVACNPRPDLRRYVLVPPRIHYLASDNDVPSWGTATLYHHVEILRRNGFDAVVVHQRKPFRLSWIDVDVPTLYFDDSFRPARGDIAVVPEVLAGRRDICSLPCRRIVFVQNAFSVLRNLEETESYEALGYERALAPMPHLVEILRRHHAREVSCVRYHLADYFFLAPGEITRPRRRRVVLYPKLADLLPDYEIVRRLLARRIAAAAEPGGAGRWEVTELRGKSHREVARVLRESAFFVSVNCYEAFNTSVPEAMAAGCIPICYEGFGGRDFLRDGENAYVFPNGHAYPLVERLFELMDRYDSSPADLDGIRQRAYETARKYRESGLERELVAFFHAIL